MKRHILTNYLKEVKKIACISKDNSLITEAIETSDPDEFRMQNIFSDKSGPDNTLTHTIETSDPDEFRVDTTHETRVVETSDPDEFGLFDSNAEIQTVKTLDNYKCCDVTKTTFTIEQSDPDEFSISSIV